MLTLPLPLECNMLSLVTCFPSDDRLLYDVLLKFQLLSHFYVQQSSPKQRLTFSKNAQLLGAKRIKVSIVPYDGWFWLTLKI